LKPLDYGSKKLLLQLILKDEIKKYKKKFIQWPTLGDGNNFVKKSLVDQVSFKTLSWIWQEDSDFVDNTITELGTGCFVFSNAEISHLKHPLELGQSRF
jgi:hypothetical protein